MMDTRTPPKLRAPVGENSAIAGAGNGQNSLDISSLKELSNTVIGGNRMFPDGPDTLMIMAQALNQNIQPSSYNLYWSEAQA